MKKINEGSKIRFNFGISVSPALLVLVAVVVAYRVTKKGS